MGGLPARTAYPATTYVIPEKRMMKRTLFLPLALLLTAGIFSITACSKQAATQKETGVVAELTKTDTKLGEGTEATAGQIGRAHV